MSSCCPELEVPCENCFACDLAILALMILSGHRPDGLVQGAGQRRWRCRSANHGSYAWPQAEAPAKAASGAGAVDDDPRAQACRQLPRGGPVPRADGYVMGSLALAASCRPCRLSVDRHRPQGQCLQERRHPKLLWPGPEPAHRLLHDRPRRLRAGKPDPGHRQDLRHSLVQDPRRREDRPEGRVPAHAALELRHLHWEGRAARRPARHRDRARPGLLQPFPPRRAP